MGMYNELNNIKMAINQQTGELKEAKKKQIEIETTKSILIDALTEELKARENIFDDDTKAEALESVVQNAHFILYSKAYTRQFLSSKYYIIANKVYSIQKKTAPQNQDDYKKQIAIEKWNIQRERERVKLAIEREKLQQLQQKQIQKQYKPVQAKQQQRCYYAPVRSGSGGEVAKVLLYIMLAPVAIFGLILYGFISAAAKAK